MKNTTCTNNQTLLLEHVRIFMCVKANTFLKFRNDQTQAKRVREGLHQVT